MVATYSVLFLLQHDASFGNASVLEDEGGRGGNFPLMVPLPKDLRPETIESFGFLRALKSFLVSEEELQLLPGLPSGGRRGFRGSLEF